MTFRVYPHSANNNGRDICKADTYRLVPDKEKIEELKNELSKYETVFVKEHCAEPMNEIHLIVRVPYKTEWLKNE